MCVKCMKIVNTHPTRTPRPDTTTTKQWPAPTAALFACTASCFSSFFSSYTLFGKIEFQLCLLHNSEGKGVDVLTKNDVLKPISLAEKGMPAVLSVVASGSGGERSLFS